MRISTLLSFISSRTFGFPDILNRLNPSYHRKPKISPEDFVEPDARIQAENARHLAKYIFARQYHFSNVFDVPIRSLGAMNDLIDRESEIKVPIALRNNTQTLDSDSGLYF